MTRQFTFLLVFLWVGSAFGQTIPVNTRLYQDEKLAKDEVLQLDLRDYFQTYPSPGPVATFTIDMPVPDGLETFDISGTNVTLMTYKLASGEDYQNPYTVPASDFEWIEQLIEFQLLPAEAPGTVANFIHYTRDGAYENTIIHRNESTGVVFRPGGAADFNPLPIIQSGGFRIYDGDESDLLLEWIPTRPAIFFEQSRQNVKGTLAMARTVNLNSATSQFFINLGDNTNAFGSGYAVFGELLNPDEDQPVLDEFANTPIYDLSSAYPNGNPNVFPTLPFTTIPLYAPIWDNPSSYARFTSVSIPEGDPDGITYSWDFLDLDEEGVSDEEVANRAVFGIEIVESELVISRNDTGFVIIQVTGTAGDQSTSFNIELLAYNPNAMDQFPDSGIYQDGWLRSSWYDWMLADDFPFIIHQNHGNQFIADTSTTNTLYAFDYNLGSWVYTTRTLYPNLFSFRLGSWLYYSEGTGNGFDSARWFYLYDGENPRWITEDEI